MNWCISVHWKQLPRRRQEEGETRGKRGRRAAGGVGRKGAGVGGGGREHTRAAVGRKPEGCAGSGREGWSVQSSWLSPVGWPGIYSLVTLEGVSTGRGASAGGGGQSLLLNLPKRQHLRAQ